MHTRCFCDTCHGTIVTLQTKRNHQRKQLKNGTVSEQLQRKREVLSATQHSAGPSSSISPVHLHLPPGVSAPSLVPGISDDPGSLTQITISDSDLDVFGNVVYDSVADADPGILSSVVDVNPEYVHACEGEYVHEDDDFPDEDALFDNADLGNEGDRLTSLTPLISDATNSEHNHDPFVVEHRDKQETANLEDPDIPSHLLVVYTMITWLHFQFHLPHVACNAMLAFLALLFRFFSMDIAPPFITFHSATRALGVNPGIELLAVCPGCRGVYPSAGSKHMQEACTLCRIPLFLPNHTRQGNRRVVKTPVIKYPYLPLSEQIKSVLKTPGVEALLDEWRTKPRNSGEYTDIFDGRMCRLKLRAPDGSLFFSNHPHENHGPDNELRIGVNLGVDWYVSRHASYKFNNPCLGFLISVATSRHPTRRAPPRFRSATFHPNFGALSYIRFYIQDNVFKVSYVKPDVHEYPSRAQGTVPR